MRVNLIDTINRTPEYEEFISKLEKFHKQRGTLLQKEPVLGSRKLDLCEIYKSVLARGGYDKVTSEKGWRNLTIPLNLPPTCTNSAYMMKSVYTKYLEPYEKEIYWGQPATSTQATPKAHTPRERTPSSPAPSKNVYNSASQFIPEPKRQRYEPNTRTYPYHPNSLESLHGAGQTPHYTPAAAYSNEEIHTEPGPQNRILLALKSSLPNEVDWAFNNLIVLSYKCDDTFQIDSIPGLLDAILYYFDLDSLGPDHGRFDSLFNLDTDTVCMERALQIVHVTRNLSFLGNNAQTLASHDFYLEILLRGIELPSDGKKMELRHLCLDAFENLCPYITLRNRSARFIKPLKHLVYTSDRALVLGSVHSLTRFALNESNESVLSVVDDKLIQRMFELLLIKDEELVEAAVEYLYCYSNLSSKTSLELVRHMPQKSINILIKCLTWNMENEVFKDKNVSSEHLNSHSAVPASLRNYSTQLNDPSQNSKMDNQQLSEPVTSVALTPNFNDLNEPRRTIEWLRYSFAPNPDATVPQIQLYTSYVTFFGHNTTGLLQIMEFMQALTSVFPDAVAYIATQGGIQTIAIKGIQQKSISTNPAGDSAITQQPTISCRWAECNNLFASESDLLNHIGESHLNGEQELSCHWMNCTRFCDQAALSRNIVLAHVKTHLGTPKPKSSAQSPKPSNPIHTPARRILRNNIESSSIPLITSLLLRNLTHAQSARNAILAHEEDLVRIMTRAPHYAKLVMTVLNELKA